MWSASRLCIRTFAVSYLYKWLVKILKNLTFFLFADDTNIYYESQDLTEIQKTVNKELKKVRKWLDSNRLALNISETNFVIFHSPRNKPDCQIILKFGKKKISQETCLKFLGLLLDSNLSWKAHITELARKLSRSVGLFYKIRHYASFDILKFLYHGVFYPFLMYGIHVWGFTFDSYLEPIYILQKKVLKSITFSDMMAHSKPLFHDLQLLKLNDIHNLDILLFVYECVNGLSPAYFPDFFNLLSNKHMFMTRQSTKGNLFLERRNTDQYGIRSIQFSGVKLWNSIPPNIRAWKSLNTFRWLYSFMAC